MDWRPDNWEEVKAECIEGPSDGKECEACADAILEALKLKGIKIGGETTGKYWVIIIPDKKVSIGFRWKRSKK